MSISELLPWVNPLLVLILAIVGWIYTRGKVDGQTRTLDESIGRVSQEIEDHKEECERRNHRLDERLLTIEKTLMDRGTQ